MNLARKLNHANPANIITKYTDITSEDVLNLLSILNRHQVKYLLIGGLAGVFHGHIRTTRDMDLWIKMIGATRIGLLKH